MVILSFVISLVMHIALGGMIWYGASGNHPIPEKNQEHILYTPSNTQNSRHSYEHKVEVTSNKLAAHLQFRLREWKKQRENHHDPPSDTQVDTQSSGKNPGVDSSPEQSEQSLVRFIDSQLYLEHFFQILGETLHPVTQSHLTNPNEASAQASKLFEQSRREAQKAMTSIKRMDLRFNRVFNPKQVDSRTKWLAYLNFIRHNIWDSYHKIYDSGQPLLTDLLVSKKGNALAQTLFLSGFFLHPRWKDSLPPHRVVIRLYNDFIEPLILIEPSEDHPQGLELNLLTGMTSYSEETPGRIYDWRLLFFAYLEYLNKDTVVSKDDLLLFDSKRDPDQALPESKPWWKRDRKRVAQVEPIFRHTNLLFGPEPYNYPGDKPPDHTTTKFQNLTWQPKSDGNPESSARGEETGETTEVIHLVDETNPPPQDLMEELEKSASQAMKEIAGVRDADLENPETVKRMMSLLKTAQAVVEQEGMGDLFKKLGDLDASALAQLMQKGGDLTTEDLEQMGSLKEAFNLLLDRHAKIKKSNNFVSAPEAYVATAFELEYELNGEIPYLVKYFEKEEVIKRVKASRKRHQTDGFPFRILKPLMRIVFRSQSEVDHFNGLTFNEQFEWLRMQGEALLDYHLENNQLDLVPSILLAPFSANRKGIATYTTPVTGSISIQRDQLPDVLIALEEARLVHRHMNRLMEHVFRRSISMPGPGTKERYYYSYEPMMDLFAVLPLSTGVAITDPLQYLLDINKLPTDERYVFISLQRSFMGWRREILPAGGVPPNEKLAELYTQTQKALKKYWREGFYTAMELDREAIPEERRYFPPRRTLEKRRDLFFPYIPVLPFLVNEEKVQYLHPFKPKGNEIWVELNERVEEEVPTVPLSELSGDLQGQDEVPDNMEPANVRGQGDRTDREDAFEGFENKKKAIFISARVFLAAILSLPEELLRYPVTQVKLLSRFTEETVSLLEDEFSDWVSARQILSFYNISPLFSATDLYKMAVPGVDPMPKLEELYPGESKFAVEILYIDDKIQAANREVRPPSGKTLYPEPLAKYIQEMVILVLGKEIRKSRLMERDSEEIASQKLEHKEFNNRIEQWKQDNLSQQYLDFWMSPIDSLYPHFGQSGFGTRRTGIFAEHHMLRVEEICGWEIKFEEFFDRTTNTNINGTYYMKVSEAECDRFPNEDLDEKMND